MFAMRIVPDRELGRCVSGNHAFFLDCLRFSANVSGRFLSSRRLSQAGRVRIRNHRSYARWVVPVALTSGGPLSASRQSARPCGAVRSLGSA